MLWTKNLLIPNAIGPAHEIQLGSSGTLRMKGIAAVYHGAFHDASLIILAQITQCILFLKVFVQLA